MQNIDNPFAAAFHATRMAMMIADARRDDTPIVAVNDAFLELTGYGRDEVVGRNCRFLQGRRPTRPRSGSCARRSGTAATSRWRS
jgi:PAS domain S-box-containing protein